MKKQSIIIFSILQVLLSIINLFNIDNNYSEFISEIRNFSSSLKSGFIIMQVVLCLISILFLLIVFLKKEEKYHKTLIFFLILNILFGTLTNAFISIVLLFLLKKDNKNIEDKDTLTYSYSKLESKSAFIGICLYFVVPLTLNSLKINSNLLQIIKAVSLVIVMVLLFKNDIIQGIKDFKANLKENIKFVIKSEFIILGLYILACLIKVLIIKGNLKTSVNEQKLEKIPFVLLSLLAVIQAPIVEENIFRLSLRKIIKNKWIYIVISGFAFGFLHTISEPNLLSFIAISVPYVTLGLAFAYYYQKKNNIIYPMLFHAIHNGVMCLLILFVR